MKRYEIIKHFPGLPTHIPVGTILELDENFNHYVPKGYEVPPHLLFGSLTKYNVEECYTEFFSPIHEEELEDSDINFEVLLNVTESSTHLPYTNLGIKCVKRLSDNVTFAIGQYVKNMNNIGGSIHKIKSFEIKRKRKGREEFFGPKCIWITYENDEGGNWLDDSLKVNVILETHDKVLLVSNDKVYRVAMIDESSEYSLIFVELVDKNFEPKKNSIYFADESNAKIFISLNTIKYSEQEILDACLTHLKPEQQMILDLFPFRRLIDLSKLDKR